MKLRRSRTIKNKTKRTTRGKTGKKWTTAIEAAQKTLSKTGSLQSARKSLRKQALSNARRLFGSIDNL